MRRLESATLQNIAWRIPARRVLAMLPLGAALTSMAALVSLSLTLVGVPTPAGKPDHAIIDASFTERLEPAALATVHASVEMGLAPAAGPGSEPKQADQSEEAAEPDRLPDVSTSGSAFDPAGTNGQGDAVRDGPVDDDALADIIEAVRAEKEKLALARAELELREQSVRELIRVAEQRLTHMEELASRLEALLGRVAEDEEARIQTLVSLYQSMKPKEAARIFDQLELSVLLKVARRMRETKLAPIVAAMEPEKARELTRALSQPADLLQRE